MLEFHFGTMLFQVVVFLILMALVAKYALRPMLSTMQKRQDHIENEISTAESNREEAEKLLQEQQKSLNKAREEAQEIIERAKRQSESEGQQIVDNARNRSERMIEQAKEEIEAERDKAIASVRDEVADLSVMLASKVLEKEVEAGKHKKDIDAFLQQVGESV